MKRLLLALIVLFGSTLVASALPKIEIVGGTVQDWGLIKNTKEPLKATMVIKNIGNDTLKISTVQPSCGCTTAPMAKKIVAPGDTSHLDITMSIANAQGKLSKSISITSNDPDNREVRIFLKAEIYKPITIFPQFMSFADLRVGQRSTAKVVLTNETDKNISITSVEVLPPDFVVNIKSGVVIEPKKDFTVEGAFTPASTGRLQCKITLKTDNPDVPEIVVSGWGNIISNETDLQPANANTLNKSDIKMAPVIVPPPANTNTDTKDKSKSTKKANPKK